jgi:hypothetical protein
MRFIGTFVVLLAIAAAPASAATKSLKITTAGQKGIPSLTKPVKGKVTASTFGPGKTLVTIHAPHTAYVFTFRSGSIKMTADPTLKGLDVVGKWTITGGTGKFAGITGTGTMKGSLTGKPFVFSGHYQS